VRLLFLLLDLLQLRRTEDPAERAKLKRDIGCTLAFVIPALIYVLVQFTVWVARTLATDGY
jgi:hypothetical protein